MLRRLLARLAYELAVDAMNRADTSAWLRDYIYWRGISRLCSDVEQALTGGFGTFSEIRAKRRNVAKEQASRRSLPRVGLPLILDTYEIGARA